MPLMHPNRSVRPAAAASILILAALGLAACGGSSKGTSGATNASAAGGAERFAARAAALRSCLKKEGIALPEPPSGQKRSERGVPGGEPYAGQASRGGPIGRGLLGSGARLSPRLPKGVTRAQLEAAQKKCGGAFRRVGPGFDSAQSRQRFAKFAACMGKNGVKLPAPNTSGKGPIFDTKGIDTGSAAFKAADAKCAKELRTRLGAAGAGGYAGAPPNGGGPAPGAGPDGPPPRRVI